MKPAIIGVGNIGSRVAGNLVAGGESVIVAARDRTKAQALAKKLEVVLGMWFKTIREFVVANRVTLVGKIIVDPSNSIAPDGKGGFRKIMLLGCFPMERTSLKPSAL